MTPRLPLCLFFIFMLSNTILLHDSLFVNENKFLRIDRFFHLVTCASWFVIGNENNGIMTFFPFLGSGPEGDEVL